MTRCIDFYVKWKKEPNFCGLGETASNEIRKYLDFVEDFSKSYDFQETLVYRNVPMSSVKPLLRFKKDSDVRAIATKKIAQTLTDKHAVTGPFVKSVIGMTPEPKPMKSSPVIAATSEIPKETFAKNNVTDKLRVISSVLTPGQMKILSDIAEKKELDDEYAALALALIWAKERMKNE